MEGTFVGRQTIYDGDYNKFAYELLFRRDERNVADLDDPDLATSQVIINTFMEIGLENIVGSRPAFINVTGDFFAGRYPLPMSSEQVVFEVLETVKPTPPIMDGMRWLTNQGYKIALDDLVLNDETLPMLELATYAKFDVLALERNELERAIPQMRQRGLKLIAEKVETPAHFEMCKELGFDYFQGYFLSYPDVVHTETVASNRAVIISLIAQLQNPKVTVHSLEKLIAQDVVLSYRLLRYINCATFSLRREVDSIAQAILLLGLNAIRNWATLLLLSRVNGKKPREVMGLALIRARMSQLLAHRLDTLDPEQAFTTGLFSLLDAIMEMPMDHLLDQMPLTMPVKLALLEHEGELGEMLAAVIHHERGEWELLQHQRLTPEDMNRAYLDAVQWAEESSKQLLSE